jgi:tRNA (cytidine32/guanosine34-2'-O)-methyltransferase
LSRVLIKGESFGRSAWEDKQEVLRQAAATADSTWTSTEEASQTSQVEPASITHSQAGSTMEMERLRIEEQAPAPTLQPRKDVKIVAIDLQPMSPLEGIVTLRADITHPATVPLLLGALDPGYDAQTASSQASHPVDLVLSDGAPDVTGLHDLDIYVQSQLLFAALNLALCVLRPGGKFVAKIFRGRNVDLLFAQLKLFFESVLVAKPRSSRASSVEAFIVCLNFRPPPGFDASMKEPLGVGDRLQQLVATRSQNVTTDRAGDVDGAAQSTSGDLDLERSATGRWIAPFMACGDLSSYDSDASYHLAKDRTSLDPVQPPTAPPYKRALDIRKLAAATGGSVRMEN